MSKDKQLIIIGLLAMIVASVSIPEVSATVPGTKVMIEPADLVVGLSETFVVQVVIEEANNLGAFQFNLLYDPSVLQVTETALGAFLESTGNSAVAIGPEVNNAEGRVAFGAISFGSAAGPSGTGVLATITCIAQGEGSTALGLREVQVLDTAASVQRATVEDGQVAVRGTKAATPTATATSAPAATATSAPAATATPVPAATATPVPAATATPVPTNTPEVVDTLTPAVTALPSPTPIVTSPPAQTPTETSLPSPSPMPSVSVAPTETRPMEVTTPLAVPTVEPTQAPIAATTTLTLPSPTPPPPSPSLTPMPSPTPPPTIPVPAATGPSVRAALGLMLAALAVVILAAFILSRRLV